MLYLFSNRIDKLNKLAFKYYINYKLKINIYELKAYINLKFNKNKFMKIFPENLIFKHFWFNYIQKFNKIFKLRKNVFYLELGSLFLYIIKF